MRAGSVLLLALVVASASAAAAAANGGPTSSFYSKVASCVAQEVRKEAVSKLSNAVGVAQAPSPSDSVEFYAVSFTPGIGCVLMSIITKQPVLDDENPGVPLRPLDYILGAIVAISPKASRVTTNSYTCAFINRSAAYTAAQRSRMIKFSVFSGDFSDPATLFQLPADLSSLKDKVRCSYMLYGRTGYNYTKGQICRPPGNNENCNDVAPFDAPFMQWQFDRDNGPASSTF